MKEEIAGPIHAADEAERFLEGAHSPLLPLAADLGSDIFQMQMTNRKIVRRKIRQ